MYINFIFGDKREEACAVKNLLYLLEVTRHVETKMEIYFTEQNNNIKQTDEMTIFV